MDSRRSIYSCRGAGCGRCRVGLDAARKTPVEVGAPVANPFGGEGGLRNGRRKRCSGCLPDEEAVPIDALGAGVCRRNLAELHNL
jgi:hypothetical protein